MKKRIPYLIALLCGAILTFAFAPFGIWAVVPVALALVVRQLFYANVSGGWLGWWFGLGWFGAGISWVHVSIAQFGGMPLPVSIGLMVILCGYLALYPALTFYLVKRYFSPHLWLLALPFLWVASEWLRSWMLSGFPWLSLGYSQIDSPLSGWAPVIGETGISALLILLSASLALHSHTRQWARLVTLLFVVFLGGFTLNNIAWVTPEKPVNIGMVQGNIPQSLRWVPEQDIPTMNTYQQLTELVWQNDIIIWPEAAVPKLELLAQDYLQHIDILAAQHNTAIITGIVNYNFESQQAWNNLIVLGNKSANDASGQYGYFHQNRYAKHHLLPIGEFVPFENLLRPLAPLFDLPMSSFSRGGFQQTNLVANGYHLAPAICFEIAFPRQIQANLKSETDFIITVSNDAWFGHSHGPAQHMEIARMRAKEFGKGVIRATNNGITGLIDHHGQIVARLPQFEAGALNAQIYTVKGQTWYQQTGDLSIYLLSFLLFAIAIYRQKYNV